MIPPAPYKYKCPKCGYSKVVKPKSDVLDPRDWNNICPKCKSKMNKTELGTWDKIFLNI